MPRARGLQVRPWRPSQLDLYILRKLAGPAAAVLGVTLVAFLLQQTLRLIDQLSSAYGSQFTVAEAVYAVNKIGL